MRRVHIVGRKGHGKTTLTADLLREFGRRGLKVGTLKHSGHEHEVDRPGKDSHRHRMSGADPAAFVTPGATAVFLPREPDEDPFVKLAPLYAECDLVLIEGWIEGPGPKVEVWRRHGGHGDEPPLASVRTDIVAVVTDDAPGETVPVPLWPRSDTPALADRLIQVAEG